jgi:sulfur transfer complex TusBCD TusB component (DsrH family)
MKHYMIIETRDPVECRDVHWTAGLAAELKKSGAEATLMLADNGVFAAREGAEVDGLRTALAAGCKVLAERYALRERGIRESDLTRGVAAVELETIIDAMEGGAMIMWR